MPVLIDAWIAGSPGGVAMTLAVAGLLTAIADIIIGVARDRR